MMLPETDLFDKHLRGSLSNEERAQLKDILRNSASARERFADYVVETGIIVQVGSQLEQYGAQCDASDQAESTRLVEASRQVSFWRRNSVWMAAAAALMLVAVGVWRFTTVETKVDGTDVATGKGQAIALRFDGEDSLVEMSENTKLSVVGGTVVPAAASSMQLVKTGPEKMIQLESGSIKVSVAKQTGGRSFTIKSQQAEIKVVGTRFSVGVDAGKKQTRVAVQEGVVRMRGLSGAATVDLVSGVSATVGEEKGIDLSEGAIRRVKSFSLPQEVAASNVQAIACDGNLVWVSQRGQDRNIAYGLDQSAQAIAILYGLDPNSMQVRRRVDMSGKCRGVISMAWGEGSLWAIAETTNHVLGLLRIRLPDCAVEEVAARTNYLTGDSAVTYGGGYVWVGNFGGQNSSILRVDPKTGKALSRIPVRLEQAYDRFMWFDDGVWLLFMNAGRLVRIDSGNGRELVGARVPFDGRGWFVPTAGTGGQFWLLTAGSRGGDIFDATFAGQGKKSSAFVPRTTADKSVTSEP